MITIHHLDATDAERVAPGHVLYLPVRVVRINGSEWITVTPVADQHPPLLMRSEHLLRDVGRAL